ncbi:WD40 repeat domain-containing protein, partial [Spirulina sp. 06S082]|uniref:WD40 repeat domain-containing protein n=1 Tax=Spirulina sp. 06S082 TaxID=3110248 RepID=UPI002B396F01|nr:hypothetical protein [Spirulina sp. 06S082]
VSEETDENDFELEYSSEESNALIDESFGDLEAEESLAVSEETDENSFELEYSSEESNAPIDESFEDLETEESLAVSEETDENSFELEYSSEESNALIDESFGNLETEEPLVINEEISDRLAPISAITEDNENTLTSEFNVDIFDENESDELSIFSDELPVEYDINTSDEDIREDYLNRNEDREDNFFDPSLTLNPAEEIQLPSDDIFSIPHPSESWSEESPELSGDPFTLSWEEQTNTVVNQNESDSLFDPSLQLEDETVAYPNDTDAIFPPLDTDDLFEPETTDNEPLISDSAKDDSIVIENFDREFSQGDRPSEEEEEYTIFEDRRNIPISLPSVLSDSEDSEDTEVEHTILEDKRSRKTSEQSTELGEETANSEPENEFTIIEDKNSINLESHPFKIEPFTAEESDRPSHPDINPEDEQTIQLNKTFIAEDNRESEVSHLVNLSGFDDVLMRYKSTVEEVKISALKEAFDYDEPGYRLIINALREESSEIRQVAEKLLIEQLRSPKIQVLPPHKNWVSMQCLQTLRGHSYWVQDVAIAPDNRTIVSASKDGTIKLWDILTGREIRTLHGHESAVLSVAISADGERIISCSTDNTIKTWSLDTGAELNNMLGKSHKIYVLAVSPDGKTVISASADNTIKPKYDGGLEAFLNRIPSRRIGAILSLIGLLKRSPAIKIWDLDKGRPKGNFRGYSRGVTDLAISPKGDKVVSGSRDRTIKIWDFKTGKNLDTLWGHNDEIRSVAISPDGKTIISGSRDRTIKIWDMHSGHVLRTLRGHSQSVTSIAVSADGNIIASGSRDSTIKIWDFNTGEFINTLLGHTDLVRSVAICNDGKTIVSGSRDNTIKIWGSSY